MFAFLGTFKARLIEFGAAVVAAAVAVAAIFLQGKRAGAAKVEAAAAREQAKNAETAAEVRADTAAKSDSAVGEELKNKWSRP